jgi:hypothetical protein
MSLGQWSRPGSFPLTAAGQRGIHTPFPRPSRFCASSRDERHASSRELGIDEHAQCFGLRRSQADRLARRLERAAFVAETHDGVPLARERNAVGMLAVRLYQGQNDGV